MQLGGVHIQVRTVRKPGAAGTGKFFARYGKRLVAVRYRVDPAKGKRYKTVESIVAEEEWHPPPAREEQQKVLRWNHRNIRRTSAYESTILKKTCSAKSRRSAELGTLARNLERAGRICTAHWFRKQGHPMKRPICSSFEYFCTTCST